MTALTEVAAGNSASRGGTDLRPVETVVVGALTETFVVKDEQLLARTITGACKLADVALDEDATDKPFKCGGIASSAFLSGAVDIPSIVHCTPDGRRRPSCITGNDSAPFEVAPGNDFTVLVLAGVTATLRFVAEEDGNNILGDGVVGDGAEVARAVLVGELFEGSHGTGDNGVLMPTGCSPGSKMECCSRCCCVECQPGWPAVAAKLRNSSVSASC